MSVVVWEAVVPAAPFMPKILYLEDDEMAVRGLVRRLEQDGYEIDLVTSGEEALEVSSSGDHSMLLLDWNVAGPLTGVDVCRELRRRRHPGGVILLTARSDVNDKVTAFDVGADDYLTKPFEYLELAARIRAILLRISADMHRFPPPSRTGFRIQHAERVLQCGSREFALTPVQYKFLSALERARGRVLSADALCEAVWGEAKPAQKRSLYVHVNQLRAKLGEADSARLENVRGQGYRLRLDTHPEDEAPRTPH